MPRETTPELLPTSVQGHYAFAPPPADFDPLRASPEQLNRHGIPAPPPKESAAEFALWQERARYRHVVADLVSTNVHHGPVRGMTAPVQRGPGQASTTSTNWSGFVLVRDLSSPVILAAGEWVVNRPTFSGRILPPGTHCSTWVGLDGAFGSDDVLQAGIHSVLNYVPKPGPDFGPGPGPTECYAWTEWFPNPEVRILGFDVGFGDSVFVQVWKLKNGGGRVMMFNDSITERVTVQVDPPPGIQLAANCAEWIVERPTVGGQLSTLAPTATTGFDRCLVASNGNTFAPGVDNPEAAFGGIVYAMSMIDDTGRITSRPFIIPSLPWPDMPGIHVGVTYVR